MKISSGGLVGVLVSLAFLHASTPQAQAAERCRFSVSTLQFVGTATEQAQCLLRNVAPFGQVGSQMAELPPALGDLVGKDTIVDKTALRRFLRAHAIDEAQIGGSLDEPLSRANNGSASAPRASYFVIHDTSTPNLLNDPFPSNINTPEWPFNNFAKYGQVAHVFVNRVGASTTKVPFGTPFRATKFETRELGIKGKGLFLHVELIQPRRRHPNGGSKNDALAPDPGFTEAQLDRLALLYIAASTRAGHWLVPAYHAVLDTGLSDGHDDPQAFNLTLWAARLKLLLDSMAS
ncbi:MAG TPA: hypothetical protein VHU81_12710 [Thermoanaerobaculia bacterium]|nr:hypothetical protein [Thermoanaerobaculia bacterium]